MKCIFVLYLAFPLKRLCMWAIASCYMCIYRKCIFFSARVSDFESRVTFNKEAAAAALLEVEAVREAVAEAEQKTAEAR